jgi:hypothetical protein
MASLLETRRVFVVILALGLFAMAARNVTDPDVWWHLRTGQLILQSHAALHADPYSFTKFGQPWVNHEWLSDVLFFITYRTTGWAGLIVVFAAVTSATFILAFLCCDGRPYLAGALTTWAALASVPFWGVRPQTLSMLFASLFLFILVRSSARPNLLWWMLPVMLVWVNLHAGFALGIALLAVFLFGDLLDLAFGLEEWSQSRGRLQKLVLALAACVAVVPLNPYGVRMYWYPLETVHSKSIQGYVSEWLSPNFHDRMHLPVLLMMLAMFLAATVSPLRLRPRELLLLSVTTLAALHSARQITVYSLVAAPQLSRMAFAWRSERQSFKLKQHSPTLRLRLFNGIFLLAFLTFTLTRVRHVVATQANSEARTFPSAAVSFLATNRLPGPLLNHYNWGGYLIWKLYPKYRVYIDGRTDLYGDAFMDQFAFTYYISDAAWRQTLEKWQIRTAILPPDAPLVAALRCQRDWREIYGDSQAVILLRKE